MRIRRPVPSAGYVFLSVDYSAIELAALAQICIWVVGYSRMAEVINATRDPGFLHTALAGRMLGKSDDEMRLLIAAKDVVAKDTRQASKPVNFGLPGGMGAATLVLTNRKSSAGTTKGPDGREYAGIRFCILVGGERVCGVEKVTEWNRRSVPPICKRCVEVAEYQLRPAFLEQWPEVKEYLQRVSQWTNDPLFEHARCFVPTTVRPEGYARLRGGVDYCSLANNGFQSLNADGTKAAFRAVARECYTDRNSPLYGTRPIVVVHDEIFAEVPLDRLHEAGFRMSEIMLQVMHNYLPDISGLRADPAAAFVWDKNMEMVLDENKHLIPWVPQEKAA